MQGLRRRIPQPRIQLVEDAELVQDAKEDSPEAHVRDSVAKRLVFSA